jgi:hypothetical protein
MSMSPLGLRVSACLLALSSVSACSDAVGRTLSAEEAFTDAITFGAAVKRLSGAMPKGEATDVNIDVPDGPSMVVKPGTSLTLSLPWSGGKASAVQFGFGGSVHFQAPVSAGTSGMVQLDADLGADVCSRLKDVCHQISCYEQVLLPDGKTVSKAAAMTLVLDCTGGTGCGSRGATAGTAVDAAVITGTASAPAPDAGRDAGTGQGGTVAFADAGIAAIPRDAGAGVGTIPGLDASTLGDCQTVVLNYALCTSSCANALAPCISAGAPPASDAKACGPYRACTEGCACNDDACMAACAEGQAECVACATPHLDCERDCGLAGARSCLAAYPDSAQGLVTPPLADPDAGLPAPLCTP